MELPFYHDFEHLPSTVEDPPRFNHTIISQNGIQIVHGAIYPHNITGDDYNVIVNSSIIWSTHLIFQRAVKLCKCTYLKFYKNVLKWGLKQKYIGQIYITS